MKHRLKQNFETLKLKLPKKLSNSPTNFFSALFLMPLLFLQADLLTWILIAVIAGIIMIFILIAFILLPLSKRSAKPKPVDDIIPESQKATQVSTPVAAPEETMPSAPVTPQSDIPTMATLPKVESVAQPDTAPVSGKRPANIGWQIAGITDVGLRRELNEDNLIMIEGEMANLGPYGLYVVADGLGGHEAGEVASRLTVESIQQQHLQNPPSAAGAPYEEWLRDAVLAANEAVLKYQESHKEAQKMGSTLIMALIDGETVHVANVGDSRAYLLTDEEIKQISIDHSLVERLVQIGQITREEARVHKQRNVVYSIIGEKRRLEIGYYHETMAPGNRLLLCSDGLSGMVADEDLLRISRHEFNPAKAGQVMIEAAKQAGGHDNITAILVQMDGTS